MSSVSNASPLQRTPSLAELVRAAVRRGMHNLRVALPGRIERYDVATQTADVQPCIDETSIGQDGTEASEPLPLLTSVPVAFARTGPWFLSLPLSVGDYVLLLFCDRSLDDYLAAAASEARDLRSHHISDAIALPVGIYPTEQALGDMHPQTEGLALGRSEGPQIHVTADSICLGGADANDSVAVDSLVQAELGRIKSDLDDVKTALNSHTHNYVDTTPSAAVPSVTQAPTAEWSAGPSSPGATASGLVKIPTP